MNEGRGKGPGTFLIQKLQSVALLTASFIERPAQLIKYFLSWGKCTEKQSEVSV